MTKITKIQAMERAAELGVAVYRSDKIADIIARVNAHCARQREIAAVRADKWAAFRRFADRRFTSVRGATQLVLPIALPRNLSIIAGKVA